MILDRVLRDIQGLFKLERAAILLPHFFKPGVWEVAASVGYPKDGTADRSAFQVGLGLTGKVLEGHSVISADILNDPDHSGRHGSKWLTESGRPDPRPRAFYGVPLVCRRSDLQKEETGATGALVCIRPRRRFSPNERAACDLIATMISARLEFLDLWEDRINTDDIQLQMLQLWNRPMSDPARLTEILRLLQTDIPFKKMLLSVVTNEGREIQGAAAIGFRPGLIDETVRPTNRDAGYDPAREDILSYIVNNRITEPFVVDADDERVQPVTAFRYEVSGQLFLLPLPSPDLDIEGVILAELPAHLCNHSKSHPTLSISELKRFKLYSWQIGASIYEHRCRKVWRSINEVLLNYSLKPSTETYVTRLNAVANAVAQHVHVPVFVVYEFSSTEGLLVRRALYGLDPDTLTNSALAVPLKLRKRSSALVARTLIDEIGYTGYLRECLPVGKQLDFANAFTFPLRSHDGVIGVVVVSTNAARAGRSGSDEVRTPTREELARRLRNFLPLFVQVICDARQHHAMHEQAAKNQSHESLIRSITSLTTWSEPGLDLHVFVGQNIVSVDTVLEDVARLFSASLVTLFLPNRAVPLRNSRIFPKTHQNVPFVEVASYRDLNTNRRPALSSITARKVYWANKHGLTASVLRTMQPQMCPNVPKDPLWSGSQKDFPDSIPRTWMGVPIVASNDPHLACYGVLSVTRVRVSKHDDLAFTELDLACLRNVATLLGGLLASRTAAMETQQLVNDVAARFDHDLPGAMINISNGLDHLQDALNRRSRNRIQDQNSIIDTLKQQVSGLSSCLQSLIQTHIKDHKAVMHEEIDLQRVFASVKALVDARPEAGGVKLRFDNNLPATIKCFGDEGNLVYVLYILACNACTSCLLRLADEQRKSYQGAVSVTVAAEDSRAQFRVCDNGIGFEVVGDASPRDSRFRGHGLGLLIAETILNKYGQSVRRENIPKGGAIVSFYFPTSSTS